MARRLELPQRPLREAVERRLFEIAHEIADLYPCRPAPAPGELASDSEAS